MITLGTNRHHHSNACVLENGNLVFSLEEDRLSKSRYDGLSTLNLIEVAKRYNLDLHADCGFYQDDEFKYTNTTFFQYIVSKLYRKDIKFIDYSFDHHLCHAAGAFYNSNYDNAISIVLDGIGSKDMFKGVGESYSAYLCSYPNEFKIIDKKYTDTFKSLGTMYAQYSEHLGFKPGDFHAGKTMGLSSYGKKDKLEYSKETKNMKDFSKSANLAKTLQLHLEEKTIELIKDCLSKTNTKNICMSGGVILNCVNNYNIIKTFKDVNFYFEPVSHDAGTSIGAAKLAYYNETKSNTKHTQKIFQGLEPDYSKLNNINHRQTSFLEVAKLLQQGKIVAMFQGRSEIGPRALGNRSILFNPMIENGKDIVNTVKGREWFRPFGATVLKEHALKWFDIENSPYMLITSKVKRKDIPSVTHVDNTCRIQTLTKKFNSNFYKLIEEFYTITGVPILLNTSFNLAGEPLVETFEDAIDTFQRSKLDYMFLPDINTIVER